MKKYFAVLLFCACTVLTLACCTPESKKVQILYHADGEVFHTSLYAEGELKG